MLSIRTIHGLLAISAFVLNSLIASAGGNPRVTFTKIADRDTPIPGAGGTFWSLGAPSLADGDVVFNGGGMPDDECTYDGIYLCRDGQLSLVANTCMLMPGCPGGDPFVGFIRPVPDAANVTFVGVAHYSYYCIGIFNWCAGQPLDVLVPRNTPDPGGYGVLSDFFTVSRDDGALGFSAWTSAFTHGIYLRTAAGEIALVANYDTAIPAGPGEFSAFEFNPTVGDGIVAFTGGTDDISHWGVYTGLPVKRIADTNTPIPKGTGTFTWFGDRPSIDGGYVGFYGQQTGAGTDQKGIYTNLGGHLRVVADLNTPIPGGVGTFTDFTSFYGPCLREGRIAFRGFGEGGQLGIYCEIDGLLLSVVDLNETRLEPGLLPRSLFIDEQCLSGNRLGFYAEFDAETPGEYFAGVYVATIHRAGVHFEPSGPTANRDAVPRP